MLTSLLAVALLLRRSEDSNLPIGQITLLLFTADVLTLRIVYREQCNISTSGVSL
jgi:hypothetical protein